MKRRRAKVKRRKEPMPNIVALFLLVVGLFLGTVFTVGMSYWNAPLERDDAEEVAKVSALDFKPTKTAIPNENKHFQKMNRNE